MYVILSEADDFYRLKTLWLSAVLLSGPSECSRLTGSFDCKSTRCDMCDTGAS